MTSDTRNYSARNKLRELPVSDLYQLLLPLEKGIKNRKYTVCQSDTLVELSKKYCNYNPSLPNKTKSITLSKLTAAVYDAAKISKDNDDLHKVYDLLVIPDKYLNTHDRPEYYSQLSTLGNTRFFRKKMIAPVPEANEKDTMRIVMRF